MKDRLGPKGRPDASVDAFFRSVYDRLAWTVLADDADSGRPDPATHEIPGVADGEPLPAVPPPARSRGRSGTRGAASGHGLGKKSSGS